MYVWILEPGESAGQLLRIIVKWGQWIKVTERWILSQYKKELPEDENFPTIAQTSSHSSVYTILEEFKPHDGHLSEHPVLR